MSTKTPLLLAAAALACSACFPHYEMSLPTGFKRYEDVCGFKAITARGVRLKVREVDNEPEGDLAFWTEAMGVHLEKQGYVKKQEECFKTKSGLDGCYLEFHLPHGQEDWVMGETIFVADDRIVLVETAGPFALYDPEREGLREALGSFDPGR